VRVSEWVLVCLAKEKTGGATRQLFTYFYFPTHLRPMPLLQPQPVPRGHHHEGPLPPRGLLPLQPPGDLDSELACVCVCVWLVRQ